MTGKLIRICGHSGCYTPAHIKMIEVDESEEGDRRMTIPREWPNNMAECRDQAAERMQEALIKVERLECSVRDTPTLLYLALIKDELNQGLRWLERAGAATTPKRM